MWIYLIAFCCSDPETFCKPFLGFINTSVEKTSQLSALYPSQFLTLLYFLTYFLHLWYPLVFRGLYLKLESKKPNFPLVIHQSFLYDWRHYKYSSVLQIAKCHFAIWNERVKKETCLLLSWTINIMSQKENNSVSTIQEIKQQAVTGLYIAMW